MPPYADVVDRPPTLDEYLALADSVGWSKYVSPDTARVALASSLFAVVAEASGRLEQNAPPRAFV